LTQAIEIGAFFPLSVHEMIIAAYLTGFSENIFLSGISFFVLEILMFFYYAN